MIFYAKQNAYEFVRDQITHSWDVRATVVSKTASEVLQNGTGICWVKSCLLTETKPPFMSSSVLNRKNLHTQCAPQFSEVDYFDNNVDLDERLVKILNEVDLVMNIRTDFEMY